MAEGFIKGGGQWRNQVEKSWKKGSKEQVTEGEEKGDKRGEGDGEVEEEVNSDEFWISTEWSSCESSGEDCLEGDDEEDNSKCTDLFPHVFNQ